MLTAVLLLVMSPAGATPRMQSSPVNASPINILDPADESPADLAALEERDFVLRLNGLSRALSVFVETYKNGRVDVKEVKALQKAMHELEKSEWFRPPKAK